MSTSMQTNSYAAFNFLSNLLFYSLTDASVYTSFLNRVNSISGVRATSGISAMVAAAQHPFDNVLETYNLYIISGLPAGRKRSKIPRG